MNCCCSEDGEAAVEPSAIIVLDSVLDNDPCYKSVAEQGMHDMEAMQDHVVAEAIAQTLPEWNASVPTEFPSASGSGDAEDLHHASGNGLPTFDDLSVALPSPGATLCPTEFTKSEAQTYRTGVSSRFESIVTSGQTKRDKVQFGTYLISPMTVSITFANGINLYVLKFGADVGFMGVVGTILSVWGPCVSPIAGYLMDKGLLSHWFPLDTWGRRAPWFLTHSFGAGMAVAALFLPLNLSSKAMCAWFLVWGLVVAWSGGVMFNCGTSARAELYPTKEERSEVEFVLKIMTGIANTCGVVPQLVILTSATSLNRLLCSGFYFFMALVSLVSIPLFRAARQPSDTTGVRSFPRELLDLVRIPVFRHFLAYKFFEGILYTTFLSTGLYYLTLVEGLRGARRSFYVVVLGAAVGTITFLVTIPWTLFFRERRDKINANVVSALSMSSGLLSLLVLAGRKLFPPGIGLIIYCSLLQASLTGSTFWRAIALGWIIDEDCHRSIGRRREAIFAGGVSLIGSIGRAVSFAIVLNGLSAAGMHLKNCARECDDVSGPEKGSCTEACDLQNFEGQPESVRLYLNMMLFVVIPVCQIACAILTGTFPIYGSRLRGIYDKQKEIFLKNLVNGGSI